MPHDAVMPGDPSGAPSPAAARRARGGRCRHASGVTALELMLAVAIVGVLAAIALPAYENYRERVRVAQAVVDIGAIGTMVAKYGLDNGAYPDSLEDAGAGGMRDP